MKEKIKRIRYFCVYIFFILMTLTKVTGMDSTNKIYYVCAFISGVLASFVIVTGNYTKLDVLKIIIICGIPIIGFYYNHSLTIIMLALALSIVKDMNIESIIKTMGIVWITVIILAIIGTVLGIVPIRTFDDDHSIYKWFYPGHNPFHEAIVLFMIYYYMIRKKAYWYEAIIFGLVNIYLFKYTTSSGGLISSFLVIIGFTVWHYTNKNKKLWKILGILMIVGTYLMILFSFIIGILYDKNKPMFVMLDHFFTNRVHVMHDAFDLYPITLFGNKLDNRIGYVLDNAYLDLFVEYGIAIFIAFLVLYTLLFFKLYKNNKYVEIMVCCIIMVYSIVEQFLRHCFLNFTLIYFGYVIWNGCSNYINKDNVDE